LFFLALLASLAVRSINVFISCGARTGMGISAVKNLYFPYH